MLKYGCTEDSIWDLINTHWEVFEEFPYVLVTCLDSNDNVQSVTTAMNIVESEIFCSYIGNSLLVAESRFIDVSKKYDLFSHFDEIWLFKDRPSIEKPENVSLQTPVDLYEGKPSKELLKWFKASKCVLGLGDGVGMNFITTSEKIVQSLKQHEKEYDFRTTHPVFERASLNSSILNLIQSKWSVLKELPFTLVTRLNKIDNIKSTTIAKKIVESESSCSFLGSSLLVKDSQIIDIAQKYNFFNNYSEIWLYKECPIIDKPFKLVIPSSLNIMNKNENELLDELKKEKELIDWMIQTKSILGLSDGTVLNYISTSREITQSLYKFQTH